MPEVNRRVFPWALLAVLSVIAWSYHETYLSIFDKWGTDAAFSHGYLVLPIVLWLVWRQREELRAAAWAPSWIGVLLLVAATAVWVIARGTGVLVLEQLSAVAMIPAAVLAVLGWSAVRSLALPLAFLFFAVPMGRAVVPWLMQLTADVSSAALELSGVPILRNHMYISIPSGDFEVAKACSGLKFVIAGLMLGTLYSFLTYRGWRKRLLSMAAFLVIPILLNGLRVYITIGVSHLTEMRFGPGKEHVTFGMVFFLVTMFAMFWIGRRWRDDDEPLSADPPGTVNPPPVSVGPLSWLLILVALLVPALGPVYIGSAVARTEWQLQHADSAARLPSAGQGWRGPLQGAVGWKPLYFDAFAELSGVYIDETSAEVDVYVGVYGLGTTGGAEMISYRNTIAPAEHSSLIASGKRSVSIGNREELVVRTQQVRKDGTAYRVWYWFQVGRHVTASPYRVKALEALALVTGEAGDERVITLATPADGRADQRLEAFVELHSDCLRSGFRPEACGG